MGSFVMDNSTNKEYFSNIDIGHPKINWGKWHYIFKNDRRSYEEVPRGRRHSKKTGFDAGHIF